MSPKWNEELQMATEAEDKKLEADKEREDRKDREREDRARKDGQDEEVPAWAADMLKGVKDVSDRLDALEKSRKDDFDMATDKARKDKDEDEDDDPKRPAEAADKGRKDKKDRKDEDEDEGEDPKENSEGERKDKRGRKDKKDTEGDTDEDTDREDRKDREDREDRARKDAAIAKNNRETQAKIAEMEARLKAVYTEPSMEDRNAIGEARSRADSIFQAVLGRPVLDSIPGENPISYRKRLADALRPFSQMYKNERLDSLSGNVFAGVEDRIYADASEAAKTPAVVPAGQLRSITRNDSGHQITEYIGDTNTTWAPFQAGAGLTVKFNPSVVRHESGVRNNG